jgi:hypothetical protein
MKARPQHQKMAKPKGWQGFLPRVFLHRRIASARKPPDQP